LIYTIEVLFKALAWKVQEKDFEALTGGRFFSKKHPIWTNLFWSWSYIFSHQITTFCNMGRL